MVPLLTLERELRSLDLAVELVVVVLVEPVERLVAAETGVRNLQGVEDHSDGPVVDILGIAMSVEDLRGNVGSSSAGCEGEYVVRDDSGETEVRDLDDCVWVFGCVHDVLELGERSYL